MQSDRPSVEKLADALLALGQAANIVPRLEADLAQTATALDENADMWSFLGNPAVQNDGKRAALRQLLGEQIHSTLLYFLFMLLDQGMLRRLSDVRKAFFEKVSGLQQNSSGEVVTAYPLTPDQKGAIERETGRVLGLKVHLRERVNPALIGGILIQVGDMVLDGTVDRRLEDIRKQLLSFA